MSDIYGRSVSRTQPGVTIAAVKKIIRDGFEKLTQRIKNIVRAEIAETLNIAEVDPGEIVVFKNASGKLKTSNMHLSDILTRQRNVAEDTIALYSGDGSLKPGALMSAISEKLTTHDRELDDHIKNYNGLRRNVISKFFGSPIILSLSLADIKSAVDDGKTAIEKINTDLPKLNKVKILHGPRDFINVVYSVEKGSLDWIKDTNNKIDFTPTIPGFYRFTIVDVLNFNIEEKITTKLDGIVSNVVSSSDPKINSVINEIYENSTWTITVLSSTNKNVIRRGILWVIEFVSQ